MYFPIFIDLSDKRVFVAGAGTIAERRIKTLLEFAGSIVVAAPAIKEEIRQMAGEKLVIFERCFREEDLELADIVLAATNDSELNDRIALLCREKGIPVNVCSDHTKCDFQFPSIVKTKECVIGINASGKNHKAVKQLRQQVEESLHIEKKDSLY